MRGTATLRSKKGMSTVYRDEARAIWGIGAAKLGSGMDANMTEEQDDHPSRLRA